MKDECHIFTGKNTKTDKTRVISEDFDLFLCSYLNCHDFTELVGGDLSVFQGFFLFYVHEPR